MIQQTISGVHNYCDRWCERCRFQQRCDVFLDIRAMEAGTYKSPELPAECAYSADLKTELTPEESREAEEEYRLREARTAVHPISRHAKEYMRTLRSAPAGLLRTDAGDPVLALAWDTVLTLSLPISSKSRRAVHELVDDDEDVVDRTLDPRGIQSDGNGSAKLVRLLIRESIEAWQVIASYPKNARYAAADKIRALRALDEELHVSFPYAMEFIRPGFDEEES